MFNVAGIEIENSRHAVVQDNLATHNTGGILVFDLPSLPRMGGGDVHVFRNRVIDNDTPNFAPPGNIVASVRVGTGVLIMANDNVLVSDNELSGNATSNIMIISYRFPYQDAKYNPLPRAITVTGNRHGRAGFAPQLPGGDQMAAAFGGSIPPILWDGTGPANQLYVGDSVQTLSLGLEAGAPPETARPAPVELITGVPMKPFTITLPASMEAAAK
jgi:parallel beta-helix repeat protein